MKILPKIFQPRDDQRRADTYRALIHAEAKIGGELFGPVPKGHRREFFCLDEHTWVWHEEWTDAKGQHRAVTTRYDVRPNGVLKAQGNQPYQQVSLDEAINLYQAVELYEKRVDSYYDHMLQAA